MRFTIFQSNHGPTLGLYRDGLIVDVAAAASGLGLSALGTPEALYRLGLEGLDSYRELLFAGDRLEPYLLDPSQLDFAPAVPAPSKLLCIGLNYRRHAEESGMAIPAHPVLFSKFANALSPHGGTVDIGGLEQVDYESELAVVMGRRARGVSESEALGYVLGYTVANDLSERRLQFLSGQWLLGKTIDGFLPLGPDLVTTDEIPDPQRLAVRGWLNGELRQDSNTADMVFSVAQIIAFVSRFMTLEPGDVICTGTPEGVVMGMAEKRWLQPGDEFVAEIEGVGRLSTRLA